MGVPWTVRRSGIWAPQRGSTWGPLWGHEACALMGMGPEQRCTNKVISYNGGCMTSSTPKWKESWNTSQ